MAGARIKGFMKNLETNEIKQFYINPTNFMYSRSATYNESSSPSSPYPLISYGYGNSSSFPISLYIYDGNREGKIESFIQFLDSIMPQADTGGFVERNPKPKPVIVCYGTFIKKCVLTNYDYDLKRISEGAMPIEADLNLNFLEIGGVALDPIYRPTALGELTPINSGDGFINTTDIAPSPYTVNCYYTAHCENIGWQPEVKNGEQSGTTGMSLRLEALKIRTSNDLGLDVKVTYQAHIQNIGWTDLVPEGAQIGTVGQWLRLEAVKIFLIGADAGKFDVLYRVHVQDLGWMKWVKNGNPAGSAGFSLRGEAVEIHILPKAVGV